MIKITAGLDIGNGYVKGRVSSDILQPEGIDIPSCVAYVINPIDVPVPSDKIGDEVDNIFNRMDLDFDSHMIKDQGRRLFGKRGIESGKSIESFDISSNTSKAEQDLSAILVIGCIAGTALKSYWKENNKLPDEILKVSADIAVALPINEYKSFRDVYASRFCEKTHFVSFHNFEQPVRMEITFTSVKVLAEGASAQFAIISKGEPLMDVLLKDVHDHGVELPGVTSKDVLNADGTVGIDIGEGTVNFPVFINKRFNTDASSTLDKGYGTVLDNSLEPLRTKHMPFNNRKALAEFLQQPDNPLIAHRKQVVKSVVDGETANLVRDIVTQFTRVMNQSNGLIQVAYVYGGGATPVRELLYDALIKAAQNFTGGASDFPILYLDSTYSRYLNREGLYTLAKG